MKAYPLIAGFFALCLLLSCDKKKERTITIANPIVVTTAVSGITNNSAFSGGNVTDTANGNVIAKGVCWGVNLFPTIENNSKTVDGPYSGAYTSTITGLLRNQTYYVRAYATNEEGTGYGDHIKFTTSPFSTFKFGGVTIFVHPDDSILSPWGTFGAFYGANNMANGRSNTAIIASHGGASAAKVCTDLTTGGFTDWYLPSKDELEVMFMVKNQIGGFNYGEYWSSTESTDVVAYAETFVDGVQSAMNKGELKYCRCIRKD